MKTSRTGWVLGTLFVLSARAAHAEPERFGDQGQLVLDQSFNVAASQERLPEDFRSVAITTTNIGIAPSASYFVLPRMSVGARLNYGRSFASIDTQGTQKLSERYGGGVSVGYAVPLGEHLALWPSLGGDFQYAYSQRLGYEGGGDRSRRISGSLQAPLLWLPATHFFIGAGPRVEMGVIGYTLDDTAGPLVSLGLLTQIGGYFEP